MNIWLSLLVCILGLLMYIWGKPGKVEVIGLHCFWVGLLTFLLIFGGRLSLAIR